MTKSLPEQSAVALTPQKTTLAWKALTQAEITFSGSTCVFKQTYEKLTFKFGHSTLFNTCNHNHGQGAEQRVTQTLPRAAAAWPRCHGVHLHHSSLFCPGRHTRGTTQQITFEPGLLHFTRCRWDSSKQWDVICHRSLFLPSGALRDGGHA